MTDTEKRHMRAYYYEFTPATSDALNAVLEAVAIAGKSYHCTSGWGEPIRDGTSLTHWQAIELAAHAASYLIELKDAQIAELEAERDRLRSENVALKTDRDTWYARAVSLLWRGHADDLTAGKIQEVARRIEKILKAAEPKGAVVATRPDTSPVVSPEAADRHTQEVSDNE